MRLKTVWLSLGGILLGFVVGFIAANSMNRSQINQLRADLENAKNSEKGVSASGADLSDDEIRDKIAEADADPQNVAFQKNLGLALYRYGSLKNDAKIISESIRLLERASKLSPSDSEVTVGLGNAWFDVGYANKDRDAFEKARRYYEFALAKAPQDAGVRTDLGMTYFLIDPPDDQKATDEFKKALAADPKNQKALQFIVQSTSRLGDRASALKYLDKLRQAYPSDEAINTLAAQIDPNSTPPSK